jgi:hypothetical protein
MPSDSWTAAICVPAKEYLAELELRRLGVTTYLPQQRKLWLPRGEEKQKPLRRSEVLFKGYIFILAKEARGREVRLTRTLRQPRPLLCSSEGAVWTCPAATIFEIARLENEGKFDEVPPEIASRARLKGGGVLSTMDLLISCLDTTTAQVLSPLFGGVRATVKTSDLVKAG